MKIGLNTYSFRNELEKGSGWTLEKVWKIVEQIGLIEGIELLDRHIPGWPNGDIRAGIKQVQDQISVHKWTIYGLGPHLHLYRAEAAARDKEIAEFRRWIDLAGDLGVPNIRTQIQGPWGFFAKHRIPNGIKVVKRILDAVLPYAEQRHVKIGIETHWGYSSWPPYLNLLMTEYQQGPALGIIYDWGNWYDNPSRYQGLELAARPHNHVYNHVKIFNFNEHFQEINYDSMLIVKSFADQGFKGFFSIEFEGKQPTIEGIFKSVHGLKYAITGGSHQIPPMPNFEV